MKCFVQLSHFGDIASILPILKHEAGEGKTPLVVAKEYASILDGVSYVEPVIWTGLVSDVVGAVKFAKKKFGHVVNLQMHGNLPVEHATPSFQFDQWKRAGVLEHFEDWPLVFDQRDGDREKQLGIHTHGDPYILFGDHSQSSPFLHKEELATMLKAEFPGHRLIRLSEVRSQRIYDVLGLYDRAACLVTTETVHVHLSKASRVPTVVLAADGWRGSAFDSRFKLHMRYGAWERRKDRVIEAVRNAIENTPPAIKVTTVPNAVHGYNYSICEHDGAFNDCYRAHANGTWKTQLFLNGGLVLVPDKLKHYSIEDARLFVHNGRLHAAYTVSTAIDGRFGAYQAYGAFTGDQLGHIQVRYRGNDLIGMQKNWCPFVHDGRLHFIYGIQGPNQLVLQVDDDQVRAEYKSPAPVWSFGEIRGGVVLPRDGETLLRFFHSRVGDYYAGKYFVGASIIEAKPPFKTIAVSSKPIIEGDERYTPGVNHWKTNVAICYGAIRKGDRILLSYGRNDCECCVAELTEKDFNL